MTELELAYLAGIVDGEGSITARNYWAPKSTHASVVCRMRVFNTHKPLIDWISSHYPGRVYAQKQIAGQKTVWIWETKGQAARDLALELLPYLKVKKRQAEILIALIPLIFKRGTCFRNGIPETSVVQRNSLVSAIRLLNHRGIPQEVALS